jgi:hypothetical protein
MYVNSDNLRLNELCKRKTGGECFGLLLWRGQEGSSSSSAAAAAASMGRRMRERQLNDADRR